MKDLEKASGKKVLSISAVAQQGVTECLHEVNQFITRERRSVAEDNEIEEIAVEEVKKPWSPLD